MNYVRNWTRGHVIGEEPHGPPVVRDPIQKNLPQAMTLEVLRSSKSLVATSSCASSASDTVMVVNLLVNGSHLCELRKKRKNAPFVSCANGSVNSSRDASNASPSQNSLVPARRATLR